MLTTHCCRRIQVKSSAVEALQKSHIENIAAFLGKSSSQATKVLGCRHREPHRRKTCVCLLSLSLLRQGLM